MCAHTHSNTHTQTYKWQTPWKEELYLSSFKLQIAKNISSLIEQALLTLRENDAGKLTGLQPIGWLDLTW